MKFYALADIDIHLTAAALTAAAATLTPPDTGSSPAPKEQA